MNIEKIIDAFLYPKIGDKVYITNYQVEDITCESKLYEIINVQEENNGDPIISILSNSDNMYSFSKMNYRLQIEETDILNLLENVNKFKIFIESQNTEDLKNPKKLNKKYKAYNIFKLLKSSNNDMETIDRISEII